MIEKLPLASLGFGIALLTTNPFPFNGKLLDENGKPESGAQVMTYIRPKPNHGAAPAIIIRKTVSTDADGRFSFPDLSVPLPIVFAVILPNHHAATATFSKSGDTATIKDRFATLNFKVVDTKGVAIPNASLRLLTATPTVPGSDINLLPFMSVNPAAAPYQAGSDGTVSIPNLVPNLKYGFECEAQSHPKVEGWVILKDQDQPVQSVVLSRAASSN